MSNHRIHINIHDKDYIDTKPSKIVMYYKKEKNSKMKPITEVTKVSTEIALAENQRILSYDEFWTLVTEKGHAWCPSLLATPNPDEPKNNGLNRRQECFTSLQLLGLDFDNTQKDIANFGYVTWSDILNRCRHLGLHVWGIYPSPSFLESHHKFRVVFKLHTPITDWRAAKAVVLALKELFPEADKACKQLNQIFFGANGGTFYRNDKAFIDVAQIFSLFFSSCLNEKHNNGARRIKSFCLSTGIKRGSKYPLISWLSEDIDTKKDDVIEDNAYKYIYTVQENVKILQFEFDQSEETMRYGVAKHVSPSEKKAVKNKRSDSKSTSLQKSEYYIKHYDFEEAQNNCRLFAELKSGELWADYLTLVGIKSNLMYINGGCNQMDDILDSRDNREAKWEEGEHVDGSYDICDRKGQFRTGGYMHYYLQSYKMSPWKCETYCNYYKNCALKSFRNAGTKRKQEVVRIQKDNTASLDEIRDILPEIYDSMIQSDSIFSVLRVDTGVGKTYQMQNKMIEHATTGKRIIYAASTYELGRQTEDELSRTLQHKDISDVRIFRFADIRPYLPAKIKAEVEFLYSISSYGKAAVTLQEWIKKEYRNCIEVEPHKRTQKSKDIISYKEAMDALKDNNIKNCILILTHAKYINSPKTKADIVFIDEDILKNHLIQVKEFQLPDLKKLVEKLEKSNHKDSTTLKSILTLIENSPPEVVVNMPSATYDTDALLQLAREGDIKFNSKILDFLTKDTLAFQKTCYHGDNTIFFVSKRQMPKRKTIIASATVNEAIYTQLLGDDVEFISTPMVEYRGCLKQYTAKGYANSAIQRSITRNSENNMIMRDFEEICKGKNVICTIETKKVHKKQEYLLLV